MHSIIMISCKKCAAPGGGPPIIKGRGAHLKIWNHLNTPKGTANAPTVDFFKAEHP